MNKWVYRLDETEDNDQFVKQFGGKAHGLRVAQDLGFSLPKTWLIPTQIYHQFIAEHPQLTSETFIPQALKFIDKNLALNLEGTLFAVRSSSQIEDGVQNSYAGVFDTCLNVAKNEVNEAIAKVWKSAKEGEMGVVIQPMIEAKYAGVCFSKHPSPTSIAERDFIVVEYGQSSGEDIVSGRVKPTRLMGLENDLVAQSNEEWVEKLIRAQDKLKQSLKHEVDIEFAIDERDQFWLLQQRPISTIAQTKALDLSHYERRYKRQLSTLDIEMLIEGCSRYLPNYLGMKFDISPWMVMTSDDQAQSLWVHRDFDQAIVDEVKWKIETEPKYLHHIQAVYHQKHKKLLTNDYEGQSFEKWWEMMLPLAAHYYVPMFMIDALHSTLLAKMEAIDPKNAKQDLYDIGTYGIESLYEQFEKELRATLELSDEQLDDLANRYGFLKCHQPYQKGYTAADIRQIEDDLEPKPKVEDQSLRIEQLRRKYRKIVRADELFDAFREWMRIRNQDMEYYYYACNLSYPLFEKVAEELDSTVERVWNTSSANILTALQSKTPLLSSTQLPSIYRLAHQTVVSYDTHIKWPAVSQKDALQGDVVTGSGEIIATVKIAFKPEDLDNLGSDPIICVTGMTSPDFIPFMKSPVIALVTDEGGILCHAAILAREMNLPTIVGTSHATDHLKDGMKVKLNFDQGTVSPQT